MIGIKEKKVVIDYTPEIKKVLRILKKFAAKKRRKDLPQNTFFLTEDSDGFYAFAATDGAVMAVYRLNTMVYVPENTSDLLLDLYGKEFDEEKKTVSFPIRSECPMDMKKALARFEKADRKESIWVHDVSDFLHFCKELSFPTKRICFRLGKTKLIAELKCYRRNAIEQVFTYAEDKISTKGSFFADGNKLAFNAMYIIKILSCIKDWQTTFCFSDASHEVCFRDGNYTYFLMPLRTE